MGRYSTIRHNSEILRLAIEVGFDWVILESSVTVRLSVIPDCKLLREGELMRKCMTLCSGKIESAILQLQERG